MKGPTEGETGFYRVRGDHYPARVVATGIRQSGGPVDEIIVYTKYGWQDVVVRTTRGSNSCDGSQWVSKEDFRQIEIEKAKEELRAMAARLERVAA